MMPPVEVPAIRSNVSAILASSRRSISASNDAGMIPRIPPPSIDSTFTTPGNETPSSRRVPTLVVQLVFLRQPATEELLVVLVLDVMGLQPNAGHVDRVRVRREAPVRLVDVGADVARAGDHVGRVVAGLLEVLGSEFAAIDALEQPLVGVDAFRAELVCDD